MKRLIIILVLLCGSAFATNYYVDFVGGNDASGGTSTGTAWKHVKGMAGASGTAAAHACTTGDTYTFKSGVTWTNAAMPWLADCSGVAGVTFTSSAAWTAGVVTSITLNTSGDNCSAITVTLSGGGGSGATATGQLRTTGTLAGNLQFVTVTAGGSGYTSNPTVSFAGSTCTVLPTATAHIDYAIFDVSGTTWDGTNGANTGFGPIRFYGGTAALTLSNLEFRGMRIPNTGPVSGDILWIADVTSNGASISNVYAHNAGPVSITTSGTPSSDKTGLFNINQGQAYTATVDSSHFNNYEIEIFTACGFSNGVAQNHTDAPCSGSYGLSGATTVTSSTFNDIRGQLYSPALTGLDYHGNTLWNTPWDCCNQHEDTFYQHGGGVIYNNVIHDMVTGAASLYNELTDTSATVNCYTSYIFNNVIWGAGDSTPPIGFTAEFYNTACASGVPTMHVYNNTIYARGSGDAQCVNWGQQNVSQPSYPNSPATFLLKNNHCISTQGATHWYESNGTSFGTVNGLSSPNSVATQTSVDAANSIQTPTNAATQGYAISNLWIPTLASNLTVSGPPGANLFSLCSGAATPLCTSLAESGLTAFSRPNAAWQSGAYWLDSGVTAPTCTLTASPLVIKLGTSSTLTFTPANTPTVCSIDNGVGAVSCSGATPSVSPTTLTTYTATVSNAGGSNTCTATVTIGGFKINANVKLVDTVSQ